MPNQTLREKFYSLLFATGEIADMELAKRITDLFLANLKRECEEMTHTLPKTPCMNLENHTFGSCFQCEKSKGYNLALSEVISKLK